MAEWNRVEWAASAGKTNDGSDDDDGDNTATAAATCCDVNDIVNCVRVNYALIGWAKLKICIIQTKHCGLASTRSRVESESVIEPVIWPAPVRPG